MGSSRVPRTRYSLNGFFQGSPNEILTEWVYPGFPEWEILTEWVPPGFPTQHILTEWVLPGFPEREPDFLVVFQFADILHLQPGAVVETPSCGTERGAVLRVGETRREAALVQELQGRGLR